MEKLNRREAIKGIALVAGSTLISCGQEDSATKGGNGQSSGCTKKESNGEGIAIGNEDIEKGVINEMTPEKNNEGETTND